MIIFINKPQGLCTTSYIVHTHDKSNFYLHFYGICLQEMSDLLNQQSQLYISTADQLVELARNVLVRAW